MRLFSLASLPLIYSHIPNEARLPPFSQFCPKNCDSARRMLDVCGSNGKTLDRCVNQANVIFDHLGPCKTGRPDGVQIILPTPFSVHVPNPAFRNRGDFYCHQTCAEDYDPVCASDGQTYPNQCLMRNASCDRVEAPLTVVAYGTCEFPDLPVAECPLKCGDGFFPVCGTDDVTYPNKCLLHQKRCNENAALRVKSDGKCGTLKPTFRNKDADAIQQHKLKPAEEMKWVEKGQKHCRQKQCSKKSLSSETKICVKDINSQELTLFSTRCEYKKYRCIQRVTKKVTKVRFQKQDLDKCY